MSNTDHSIRCAWIPGSMTHLRVTSRQHSRELHIDRLTALLGRAALNGMYLRGRFVHAPLDHLTFQEY